MTEELNLEVEIGLPPCYHCGELVLAELDQIRMTKLSISHPLWPTDSVEWTQETNVRQEGHPHAPGNYWCGVFHKYCFADWMFEKQKPENIKPL